jgi:hypothetical protein
LAATAPISLNLFNLENAAISSSSLISQLL